jgi:uncharacterized protein (DUF2236 family)
MTRFGKRYEQFVAPMMRTQKAAYYDDSKRLARLFGIDEKPTTMAQKPLATPRA